MATYPPSSIIMNELSKSLSGGGTYGPSPGRPDAPSYPFATNVHQPSPSVDGTEVIKLLGEILEQLKELNEKFA